MKKDVENKIIRPQNLNNLSIKISTKRVKLDMMFYPH